MCLGYRPRPCLLNSDRYDDKKEKIAEKGKFSEYFHFQDQEGPNEKVTNEGLYQLLNELTSKYFQPQYC